MKAHSRIPYIYIVDDDEDDRFLAAEALSATMLPHKFMAYDNGTDFIEALSKNENNLPDVVFLDYNMPIKNGLECLESLKDLNLLNKIKVYLYSTYVDTTTTEMAFNLGAQGYLCKPPDFNLLKTLLYRAIEQALDVNTKPDLENFVIYP
ncbi:response regulator [Winogradskyella ursingii]|uniref:response regulator n=1 Tax=Winogradskyella ursingii TaxID=2686079 RepID=UPI0015C92927|nr:response regulator [Winogradskyella ursingii]